MIYSRALPQSQMTIPATQKITLLCTGSGCSAVPACVLSAARKLSGITAEGAVHATTHALLGRGALCNGLAFEESTMLDEAVARCNVMGIVIHVT